MAPASPGRRVHVMRRVPGRLHRQQRVPRREPDDALPVGCRDVRGRPDQFVKCRRGQRPEVELGGERAASAQRAEHGVQFGPGRQPPPGQHEQHWLPGDPAPGVGHELEARPVRGVQVLQGQGERPVARRPAEQCHRRLEEADPVQARFGRRCRSPGLG